jgi:hypothetical protein
MIVLNAAILTWAKSAPCLVKLPALFLSEHYEAVNREALFCKKGKKKANRDVPYTSLLA